MRAALLLPLSLPACWKDEYATLPGGTVRFDPLVEAPVGWLLATFETNVDCPDDENATFYFLYPEDAVDSGEALASAVVAHSGSFDFVFAADALDPLEGVHFAVPSRLGTTFAVRQIYATLGMYPSQIAGEEHMGLLPAVLAENRIAMMLPANCWGDLWHSASRFAENDVVSDHFPRLGRTAAEWAYLFLTDPVFAASFDVSLPIAIDPARLYAVGFGEGGRAIAELVTIDNDTDGSPDYTVSGALVDGPPDDLRVLYEDPALYASVVEGLDRIFPPGVDATASGSFWAASLPPRIGYAVPDNGPVWPDEVHDAAVARIEGAGGWIHRGSSGPLQLDGDDKALVEQAVHFMLDEE
jgi:hypothetical protein